MAFFKSRTKSNSSAESVNHDAQSMDSLRKQARHRLIGATVLVFIAVVGFPIVFDTKPRDIASDIRIDMPERDAVKPSQPPLAPVPDKAALTQPSVSEAVSGNEQLVQQDSKILAEEVPAAGEVNQAIEKKSTSSKPVKADNTKSAPVAIPLSPSQQQMKKRLNVLLFNSAHTQTKPRSKTCVSSLRKPVSKPIPMWLKPAKANAPACELAPL